VRGHADAETLAAFREELLSRRKAARVSAHLAACSRCAGLDAQLAEVRALLTRTTAPPMPDALTARIEAAIAAEAATRAATAADGSAAAAAGAGAPSRDGAARPSGQPAGRTARPPARPRRSILALRVAAVTAAVVVIAGGGYGVAKLLAGSPGNGTAAVNGAAAPKAPAPAPSGPRMSAGGFESGGGAAASGAAAARIVSSGTNYQPSQLKSQVSAVLAQHGGSTAEGPGPSPNNRPASTSRQLPACVTQVTGGIRPLLVDHASYQGHPATVIVVPSAAPGKLRAVVVAGECTGPTSHVLATATISAPG